MTLANTLFGPAKPYRGNPSANRAAARGWSPLNPGDVLLAIDPSIANCGWAILHNLPKPQRIDSGVWHPIQRDDRDRYDHLSDLIVQRIDLASGALRITDALIEIPAGGQWARSGTQLMIYARAIGICDATCHRAGLRMHRATVNEWKGRGAKSHTALVVKQFCKYTPRDDNEADAIGLGLWLCGRKF